MTESFLEIRKKIHTAGHDFYEELGKTSRDLQNIAGEFMSKNEDYCLRYPGTNGYLVIMRTGFSENQIAFLKRIAETLKGTIVPRCSWCGAASPQHEGGMTHRDGTELRGNFCNEICFNHWKLAHTLIEHRTGS